MISRILRESTENLRKNLRKIVIKQQTTIQGDNNYVQSRIGKGIGVYRQSRST